MAVVLPRRVTRVVWTDLSASREYRSCSCASTWSLNSDCRRSLQWLMLQRRIRAKLGIGSLESTALTVSSFSLERGHESTAQKSYCMRHGPVKCQAEVIQRLLIHQDQRTNGRSSKKEDVKQISPRAGRNMQACTCHAASRKHITSAHQSCSKLLVSKYSKPNTSRT
jgi:hypothetical protein